VSRQGIDIGPKRIVVDILTLQELVQLRRHLLLRDISPRRLLWSSSEALCRHFQHQELVRRQSAVMLEMAARVSTVELSRLPLERKSRVWETWSDGYLQWRCQSTISRGQDRHCGYFSILARCWRSGRRVRPFVSRAMAGLVNRWRYVCVNRPFLFLAIAFPSTQEVGSDPKPYPS
jgi:hypothetical protein